MITKKTLGILATLALASVMSLGCSDSSDDSGTDGGGTGTGGDGGGTGTGGDGGGTGTGGGGGGTGTGGGGGGTTTGNYKAECDKFCDKQAASNCLQKDNADKCKQRCKQVDTGLSANTDCGGTFAAEQACLNTKDIKCDSNGKPIVEGCIIEKAAALECIAKYDSGYGCEAACKKSVPSEKCGDNDFANEERCKEECVKQGRSAMLNTKCVDKYKEALTCQANNDSECLMLPDGKYYYVAQACLPKYLAYYNCLPKE